MNKVISLICAILLVLSLTVTAAAATSSPFPITSTDGTVTEASGLFPAGVENTANARKTAADLGVENTDELTLFATFNFKGTPGEQNLTIQGAANRRVVLLQNINSEWKVVYDGTADSNGTIYFKLDSFTQFALLIGKEVTAASSTSPNTADNSNTVLWGAIAVCSLAGACYVFKRAKN